WSSERLHQDRSVEELLGFGIDQDLHEAQGRALLKGTTDVLHCHLGHQRGPTGFVHLGLRHAEAEQRIGGGIAPLNDLLRANPHVLMWRVWSVRLHAGVNASPATTLVLGREPAYAARVRTQT